MNIREICMSGPSLHPSVGDMVYGAKLKIAFGISISNSTSVYAVCGYGLMPVNSAMSLSKWPPGIHFYPKPFRPKGYCRCLRLSVRPSVCLSVRKLYLVRTITRHRFELEICSKHASWDTPGWY